jgi:hypothetical protein
MNLNLGDGAAPPDQGLIALTMLLNFNGIAADPEQLRHRFGGSAVGVTQMLRLAKELGLKARLSKTSWGRLGKTPLPAIAALRDGGFLVLGKLGDDEILVQAPGGRPQIMIREELEAIWDGRLVLMTRRAGLVDLTRRFDITWFLGAIKKYRRLLTGNYHLDVALSRGCKGCSVIARQAYRAKWPHEAKRHHSVAEGGDRAGGVEGYNWQGAHAGHSLPFIAQLFPPTWAQLALASRWSSRRCPSFPPAHGFPSRNRGI